MRYPLEIAVKLTWRELFAAGAFAQRELASEGSFRSAAKDRGCGLGIGHGRLEELDAQDALRPVAFALSGYWSGMTVPAEDPAGMRFVDEGPHESWDTYEWHFDDEQEHPNVSPLYSPWQLLYVDQLHEGADDAWQGAVKVLVALQNRYWPGITGREKVVHDPDSGGWARAGPAPAEFDPAATLDALETTGDDVLGLYHLLVEAGLDRDPVDGLTLLRRARPRAFHLRWRGAPLRAQDQFDGAEVLRRFLTDLTGEPPSKPDAEPLDGRQYERSMLYERGPGATWTREQLKDQLHTAALYPHGIHVVGEGESEKIMVEWIVTALVGEFLLAEIGFHDLGGSGSAAQVEPIARALGTYALSCPVIVDREGPMAEYLETAIANGQLDAEDVCLFDDSLEASNFRSEELIAVAQKIGANRSVGEPSIEFELGAEELDAYHADRVARSAKNPPGKAESLLVQVGRKTEGRLSIDKRDFVEALGRTLAEELGAAEPNQMAEIRDRRPIVGFVIDRVIQPLNQARPLGSQI